MSLSFESDKMYEKIIKSEPILEDSQDPYDAGLSSQPVIDWQKTLDVKGPVQLSLKDILPRPQPKSLSSKQVARKNTTPVPRKNLPTPNPNQKPTRIQVARKRTTPIPKKKVKRAPASTSEDDKPVFEFEFEVESIRGKRVQNNKIEYLIKWVGWAPSECTWEPEEHLENCKDIVDKYNRRTKKTYEQDFEVERIVGKETDGTLTFYLVKWVGWADKYNTWEPEKHLTHCPRLVDAFNEEERKKGITEPGEAED